MVHAHDPGAGLPLTGAPFFLVRKMLPFIGTWGPFCGIV